MQILNFYEMYLAMTQKDQQNLFWAMKQVRKAGLAASVQAYSAWSLFLLCTTKVKTRKNFLESIRYGKETVILKNIAQEIARPELDLIIGTTGKFFALSKNGVLQEIWDDFESEEIEKTVYQITREDLLNIKGLRNDN